MGRVAEVRTDVGLGVIGQVEGGCHDNSCRVAWVYPFTFRNIYSLIMIKIVLQKYMYFVHKIWTPKIHKYYTCIYVHIDDKLRMICALSDI